MLNLAKIILWIAFFVIAWLLNPIFFVLVMLGFFVYIIYKAIPVFWALKANVHFNDGEYRKACEHYKKANKRNKVRFSFRFSYGCTLMRTGDFDGAEAVFNGIIRDKRNVKDIERNQAKQQRCMVYMKQGRLDDAMEEAMELFNSGYRNSFMYAMIGYFKMLKNEPQKEVTAFCEEAYKFNNDSRDILDNLSICYYNEGKYEKAKEISDKLMKLNPTFAEAYYHGAQIALRCNDYDKARKLMQGLDQCHMSAMTTVTRDEIKEMKRKLGLTK